METKSRNKLIYGGMATAMAVVLIAGVSVTQLSTLSSKSDSGYDELAGTAVLNEAELSVTDSGGRNTFASITHSTGSKTPLATPIEPPVARLSAPDAQAPIQKLAKNSREEQQDPLSGWRTLQKEKQLAQESTENRKAREDISAKDGRTLMAQESMASSIMPISPPVIVGNDAKQNNYYHDVGRDKFENFEVNAFKTVNAEPVSTFSTDVDTASYSFVRAQLNNGILPQKDAVRVEEMVNYFDYNYALPETSEQPFKPTVTIVDSPWASGKKLMHIGIKGFDVPAGENPRSNLVFLLDTSGSMNEPNKLPLVINSLKMMLESLRPDDTIAIAAYAGSAGTILEPTKVSEKQKIISALENLSAGGGTAGAEGINLAYQLAEQNFDREAVNRVILATDGDFNVGITNPEELQDFVEHKREKGIFLSVLGFGQGNYNDQIMQTLAQNGNGVAAYIDTLNEARKVLVDEATSTLFPIAKDVKIQVEFNPAVVAEYRLIGYETRHLNREDFNNDAIDAGDIGAGHTVTAIYEIVPVGGPTTVDELRYSETKPEEKHNMDNIHNKSDFGGEFAFVKIRYKLPDENVSKLITTPVTAENQQLLFCPQNDQCKPGNYASNDTVWATAVAGFGQILQGGKYTTDFGYDDVIELAQDAKGTDEFGQRAEFINLVRLAKSSSPQ